METSKRVRFRNTERERERGRGREGLRINRREALMSTKQQNQKRLTKQIRIEVELHKMIRMEAFKRGTTASKILDEAVKGYFIGKGVEYAQT